MVSYKGCKFRMLKIGDLRKLLDEYGVFCQNRIESELKGKMTDQEVLTAVLNMKLQLSVDHIIEYCAIPEGTISILATCLIEGDVDELSANESFMVARSLIAESEEVKND